MISFTFLYFEQFYNFASKLELISKTQTLYNFCVKNFITFIFQEIMSLIRKSRQEYFKISRKFNEQIPNEEAIFYTDKKFDQLLRISLKEITEKMKHFTENFDYLGNYKTKFL